MADGISVIIPTLNEAEELPATLASVERALGAATREVIVVDGGSTDGTRDLARASARLLSAPACRGRQLDAGALSASGSTLLFLHADTWLDPDAGTALAECLARPGVVGGCFRVRLRGPTADRPLARTLAAAINARTRWLRTASGDQAIFARRSAYERAGGFPAIDLFEDVVFYRRLRRLGRVAVLEPGVLTSDRRWRRRGYLRTIAFHLALRLLFSVGVPPGRLARVYRRAT